MQFLQLPRRSIQYVASIGLIWMLFVFVELTSADVYINQFAVHIEGGHHVADRVARETGLINLGQIGSLDDHYLFEAPHREIRSASPSHDHHAALTEHSQVHWFEQQIAKSRTKRDFLTRDVAKQMSVLDPEWKNQWYLHGGARDGYDMNVLEAWRRGFTGKNIVVTILDDGLERDHPDLIRNYDPYASYDVNNHDSDPTPRYNPTNENRHGTRCAGEVSAEANNTYCTIGVAPDSRIGGIRMLDGEVYDAVEAASLSFNRSHVDIYSASWGPDDDGKVVDGPGKLAKKAFINGIEHGRNGKGSIFVWASGNGGSVKDSCNCDGYANSIYTLSISSTTENGIKPWYLEECSSTLASTYSSGSYSERQIASTDIRRKCTTTHTGTSASAPLAAGIVALVLEANNGLTWRDVQYITLMTARPEPIRDGQWITNGVGRKVSLRYGYGLMDATEMVNLALVWNTVPEKHECLVKSNVHEERLIPHQGFSGEIKTDGCKGISTEVIYLEHVQAKISLTYGKRGDMVIYLTSPMGTRSKMLPARPSDMNAGGFDEWPFLSVQFWGENPAGTWKLEIEDANTFVSRPGVAGGGVLKSWSLVFHGTKIQPVQLKNGTKATSGPPPTRPSTTVSQKPATTVTTATGSKPYKCHEECAGECKGPNPQDCIECKHFRIGSTSECVAACPDGYYKSDQMCQHCEMSCATCDGPTLTQCLSCPPGHLYQELNAKQHVCSSECLPGFYLKTNSCLPCHSTCKECEDSATHCTACQHGRFLKDNLCVSSKKGSSAYKHGRVVLIMILVVLSFLTLSLIVTSLMYARRNGYLCWADQTYYGKLPIEDDDTTIMLYTDDPDENYKS